MTPAETGFPPGTEAWPLFTVTLDGQSVAVVRARDAESAIGLTQGFLLERLNAFPTAVGARPALSERERGRVHAREPNETEARHYAVRAAGLPPGVAAVALP